MKKLLFVLAFTFIGQQVFSQIYIASIEQGGYCSNISPPCGLSDLCLIKTDPTGSQTYTTPQKLTVL